MAWVKEGRKYDLGAVLITQQPGSIPNDILSQGDNWFIFHLLSATDLTNVKRANAHFSDDLLSVLLNEPIPGQGVFWSSVGGKPYPISLRALSFEKMYEKNVGHKDEEQCETYASVLRGQFEAEVRKITDLLPAREHVRQSVDIPSEYEDISSETRDYTALLEDMIVRTFLEDKTLVEKIKVKGELWAAIGGFIEKRLPENLDDRRSFAFKLVPKVLSRIFGKPDEGWHTFQTESVKDPKKLVRMVKAGLKP